MRSNRERHDGICLFHLKVGSNESVARRRHCRCHRIKGGSGVAWAAALAALARRPLEGTGEAAEEDAENVEPPSLVRHAHLERRWAALE